MHSNRDKEEMDGGGEIEGADENEFAPGSSRGGRKYSPVVAHDNDRAVLEMSSIDPQSSRQDLKKVKVSMQPDVASEEIEGSIPNHSVNGPQKESKLELFGFDSLVNILGLKSMTGDQIQVPPSPRDGGDVSITLERPRPSECNTYADIDAVYKCLKEQYGVKDEQLILYGQSVGSGPTVDLASRVPNLRAVVLHSPILSGVRVLYPVKRTYWFDIYRNVDKIGTVNCPVLVIHGTADEVVDCSHGKQLWELCKEKYEPLWINGGGHCNLELYPEYIKHLKKFVIGFGKPKPAANGSQKASTESDNQSKPAETVPRDTFELKTDPPEISRNSLDSRLEKTKKSTKPEKSRMSTDRVDRFRRRKGLVW